MRHAITNGVEVDLLTDKAFNDIKESLATHSVRAICTTPNHIGQIGAVLLGSHGSPKVITLLNWNGNKPGSKAFHDVPIDVINSDGFEIYVKDTKQIDPTRQLLATIKESYSQHVSLRICVEAIATPVPKWLPIIEELGEDEHVDMIRMSKTLTMKQSISNTETIAKAIDIITDKCKKPLKISGNVMNLRSIIKCINDLYGVNHKQFNQICAQLECPRLVGQLDEAIQKAYC